MRTNEAITVQEISEMYGHNAQRIIAAAEQMGIETSGSWYIAAKGLVAKTQEYAKANPERYAYLRGAGAITTKGGNAL